MVRIERMWKVKVPAYHCPKATKTNQHGKHVEGKVFCTIRLAEKKQDVLCNEKNCPNVCLCWKDGVKKQ